MFKQNIISQLADSYAPNSITESYGLGSNIDDISDVALLAVFKETVNKFDTCEPLKYSADAVPIIAKEGAECMLYITDYDELNKYVSSSKTSIYEALQNVCECNNIDIDSIAVYITGDIIKESSELAAKSSELNKQDKLKVKLELYSALKNLTILKENNVMLFKTNKEEL